MPPRHLDAFDTKRHAILLRHYAVAAPVATATHVFAGMIFFRRHAPYCFHADFFFFFFAFAAAVGAATPCFTLIIIDAMLLNDAICHAAVYFSCHGALLRRLCVTFCFRFSPRFHFRRFAHYCFSLHMSLLDADTFSLLRYFRLLFDYAFDI